MHKWTNTVNKTQTFATCYFCNCVKEYRHFGYVYYQHGNNTTLYSAPDCKIGYSKLSNRK